MRIQRRMRGRRTRTARAPRARASTPRDGADAIAAIARVDTFTRATHEHDVHDHAAAMRRQGEKFNAIDARDDARGRARARPGTTTRDEDVAMLSTPREGGLRGARCAVVDDARGRARAREGMNDEEK